MRREVISEGKTKIVQHKLRGNYLPWLSGNQNQTRVNWAEPALTVSGRFGLYFIVVINFLLLLSVDEHRVIYIRHSCAPLRYTIRNIKSNRKKQLKAHG